MASRDAPPTPGSPWGPQMGPWDAILEALKKQIPSLDSDSSSSDCEEEELFIFLRDQTALIPDLSEELAEDPADDGAFGHWEAAADKSPCEPALVSVEFPPELGSEQKTRTRDWASQEGRDIRGPFQGRGETSSLAGIPEESPRGQEGALEGVSFSTKEPQSPPGGPQGEAPTSTRAEGALATEGPRMPSPPRQGSASVDLRALRRERRKMIERDMLHKVTPGAWDSACGDHTQAKETPQEAAGAAPRPQTPPGGPQGGPPVLSLQQLEEWDLDYILQSLTGREEDWGDGGPGATWRAVDHCQGRGHTAPATQDQLMGRLARLCAAQSRPLSSARKVAADRSHDAEERQASHRCTSTRPGFQAKLGQGVRLKGLAEPPTVFIDLRQAGPPGCLSPASSSHSSSDSEEDAAAREQQGLAEGALHSPQQFRDCTGKSQLLQQLRAFRRGAAAPKLRAGEGPSGQKAQAPEDTAGLGTRRKQHVKLWAQGQGAPATLPGGSPRALGGPLGPATAKDALLPPLGQP
ncbi:dynein axonemal assembly factor 8 [Trichechus manatus latirostris]|uniref:Dynein axonemal assembly factor 8 n=1 Tax=Trichechus manatus latirostris TaxID=127582 RepID=A0A2Y9DF78_TRIMA|nr:dynein axonemal assembly factor 8 [Trichechus manatus latirostris]